ncbi:NERD nuclease [Desulfuribacillus stibiiarsenatis]|uniref:NERD nuclease n=1 Tax=Desulfuribacillus stibiiarsenatis TaxID=1390249 RepID=A0A1E5L2J2_9FIRM|nr:NERD domain-containing protein [Desulfuribacillus stibiiarsenatis]OEH84139.1 NERD nuclease [Desulfuribacillus stibiiarsenatis]
MIFKMFTELWYLWALVIIVFFYSLFKPKIKGYLGEKAIAVILSRLDSEKYKIINDIMIEVNGKTSQIDHVIVSNYGIFVIETKNYKGWILGEERSEYWTQVIYKRKERLYNPIRQNYGHIQALKGILEAYSNVVFIPIVVFSVNSNLKIKTTSEVVYSVNLLKTIKKYNQEIISNKEKDEIFSKIVALNIVDKDSKKKHISDIRQNIIEKNVQVSHDVCPRCNGQLLKRKGKNGEFKGCSNFPKCRFTA